MHGSFTTLAKAPTCSLWEHAFTGTNRAQRRILGKLEAEGTAEGGCLFGVSLTFFSFRDDTVVSMEKDVIHNGLDDSHGYDEMGKVSRAFGRC